MSKVTIKNTLDSVVTNYNRIGMTKMYDLFGEIRDYLNHFKKSPLYNSNTAPIIRKLEEMINSDRAFNKLMPNTFMGQFQEDKEKPVYAICVSRGTNMDRNIHRRDIFNEKYLLDKDVSIPQITNYLITRLLFSDPSVFNLANKNGIKILSIVISNLFLNLLGSRESEIYTKNGYGLVMAMVMSALSTNLNNSQSILPILKNVQVDYNFEMIKEFEAKIYEAGRSKRIKISMDDIFDTLYSYGYIKNMDYNSFIIKVVKILGTPGIQCLDITDTLNPAFIMTSMSLSNKKQFGSLYNYLGELKTVSKYDLIDDIYKYWLILMRYAI